MFLVMSNQRVFDRDTFTVALSERGMRIPQLAREAGASERYVYGVAAGMVPGDSVRQRIARALHVAEEMLWPARR